MCWRNQANRYHCSRLHSETPFSRLSSLPIYTLLLLLIDHLRSITLRRLLWMLPLLSERLSRSIWVWNSIGPGLAGWFPKVVRCQTNVCERRERVGRRSRAAIRKIYGESDGSLGGCSQTALWLLAETDGMKFYSESMNDSLAEVKGTQQAKGRILQVELLITPAREEYSHEYIACISSYG